MVLPRLPTRLHRLQIEDVLPSEEWMIGSGLRVCVEPEGRECARERGDQGARHLRRLIGRVEELDLAYLFSPEVDLYLIELEAA